MRMTSESCFTEKEHSKCPLSKRESAIASQVLPAEDLLQEV